MADTVKKFGSFELLELIGRGGMGVVYLARHVGTGQKVALKTVRVPKRDLVWRIRREVHALSRLSHPGIVRVVAEGFLRGVPWFAMELIEGRTLHGYLHAIWRQSDLDVLDGGPDSSTADFAKPLQKPVGVDGDDLQEGEEDAAMTYCLCRRAHRGNHIIDEDLLAAAGRLPQFLRLIRGICDTLAYVHSRGVVHRDLKPENIFIRHDGTPVIFDFSLAVSSSVGSREVLEDAKAVEGTLAYMAPEQLRGEIVDARADLFSVGCMLYEGITGRLPFMADSPRELIERHSKGSPVPPAKIVSNLPFELEEMIMKLLASRPQDRLGHASDVSAILARRQVPPTFAAVENPRGDYLYRPGFVGRDKVLQRLDRHLGVGSRGHVVLVGGESGIGKTRLVMELARMAENRGLQVVASTCLAIQPQEEAASLSASSLPLYIFRPLLQRVADYCLEAGPEETARVLGRRGSLLVPIEPALSFLAEAPDRLSSPPGRADSDRLIQALGETLVAFAEWQPVALILDDLQWADDLSLRFLARVQEGAFASDRFVVLATYRTEELRPSIEQLIEGAGAEDHLELDYLDEEAVRQIVAGMLGVASPSEPLVRFLSRRSRGNPFFVAEYLLTALAEKILSRDASGRWRLSDPAGGLLESVHRVLPLPRSLRDLISRRLSQLSRRFLPLLELAAVFGRGVSEDLLEAAGLDDRPLLLEGVGTLIRQQILEEDESGRYRFVHEKLREISYESIPAERRPGLHRRAALAIEHLYRETGGFPQRAGALAYHWKAAGNREKAQAYLGAAGAQALRAGAYQQALSMFREALRLAPEGEKPTREQDSLAGAVRERLCAQACLGLGDLRECRKHLERAISWLGVPLPPSGWRIKLHVATELLHQLLHRWLPSTSGRPRSVSTRQAQELSIIYNLLLRLSSFGHDPYFMLYSTLRSMNLAEHANAAAERADAYSWLYYLASMASWQGPAKLYARRAFRTARDSGNPQALLRFYTIHAQYFLGHAEWDRSLGVIRRGQGIARRLGDVRCHDELEGFLSSLWFLRGDFDRALLHARNQYHSALRGDSQLQRAGLLRVAQIQILRDRTAPAREALNRAIELLGTTPGRNSGMWSQALLAAVRLREGDAEGAWQSVEEALLLIQEENPMVLYRLHAYSTLAATCVELSRQGDRLDQQRQRELSLRTRQVCRSFHATARRFPSWAPRSYRWIGCCHWQQGQTRRAFAAWQRSLQMARRLHMPYDEAVAHLELGTRLDGDHPHRRLHLVQSRNLLETTVRSGPDLARTQQAIVNL